MNLRAGGKWLSLYRIAISELEQEMAGEGERSFRTSHPLRLDRSRVQCIRRRYATSNSPAAPMPPPMHIVTTTYLTPRRLPSINAWPTKREPVMP